MEDALFDHVMESAKSMLDTPVIYKYYDLDTGLKAFQGRTIAFSRPDRFNDPFDCSIELLKIEPQATRDHMKDAVVRRLGSNYAERFRFKRQMDKATDLQVVGLAKKGLKSDYFNRGVSCFSTGFDEILMWAHYCRNHNGICLGYDNIKLYEILRHLVREVTYLKVDYLDQLDKKSFYPVNSEAIFYMLKTKSKIWEYEKEVRITGVNFNFNEQLMSFVTLPEDIIKQVYIGINVSQADTEHILALTQSLNPKISVVKMKADYTSFKLVEQKLC